MVIKTMATMLVVGLVPLGLFGAITLQREGSRLQDEAAGTLQSSATWISAQVDEWVDKNVRVLQTTADQPAVRSMDPVRQAEVLRSVAKSYPWMFLVHTMGPNGMDIARNDDKPLTDYADRHYFKQSMKGVPLTWETLISRTTGKPSLVIAMPIKDNGKIVGVLQAAMAVEDISRIVGWKTGETGFAFLVDEKGKVIAHPSKELVTKQTALTDQPLIAAFQKDRQPHLVSYNLPDGTAALGYVRSNKFNWGIAVQQSEDELFAPLRHTRSLGIMILLGAALGVALIAWFSSKTLIKPLLAFARRNREMVNLLGVMEQGFLSMSADGTLAEERSAKAAELLGGFKPGTRLWDAVAPYDPTFAAWIELGWASVVENEMPLEVALAQLPGKLVLGGREYRIEYKPAIVNDTVGDTLIVLTDMTAELARARAEAAERDLLRMIERMARDRAASIEFVEETDRLLGRVDGHPDADVGKELKRDLHTLKGNCAIYGLTQIAEWCHQLEDGVELTARLDRNVVPLMVSAWSELKAKLDRVFGPQGAGLDVAAEDVAELHEAIARGAPLGIVEQIVRNWELERTRPRLERFAEQARSLASRLGKPEVAIELADHRTRLDGPRFRPFWTAFSHAVRNAVDHGLETPSDRTAAGKPETGRLELSTRRDGSAVVVELQDDGRGIDWEAVRTRARENNLPHATREELVAAMFTDGISTRSEVTETSGRGVGLAALREVCSELGGAIDVHSERGRGTRFVFRFEQPVQARVPTKKTASDAPRPRTPSKMTQPIPAAPSA